MRKTKEDTQITKDQILRGSFECFANRGYDWTTIERVAKQVGVSRGTIYWHFSDKKALYRATVDYVIAHADMGVYARQLPQTMPLETCLVDIFHLIIRDNRYVDFEYKAIAFASDKEEFQDTIDNLVDMTRRLYDFFWEKCDQQITARHLTGENPSFYADALFLLLEGMFMTKNLNLPISLSGDWIQKHVHATIAPLVEEQEQAATE